MTPEEAQRLADATLAAIDAEDRDLRWGNPYLAADRKRVTSDLAGIKVHRPAGPGLNYRPERDGPLCRVCVRKAANVVWPCEDATRYADGLLRTAALYGVS